MSPDAAADGTIAPAGGPLSHLRLHGEPDRELRELIVALTVDAIRTQRLLDSHAAIEAERYSRLVASLRFPWADLLPAPRRMSVRRWNITTRLALAVERGAEVTVKAVPLNLGFFARYETESSTHSTLRIAVDQTPVGAHSISSPSTAD